MRVSTRSLIRERQRGRIVWQSSAGPHKGRKKTLSPERAVELVERAGTGVRKFLARDYGISRETVYQYLRHAKLADSPPPGCITPDGAGFTSFTARCYRRLFGKLRKGHA